MIPLHRRSLLLLCLATRGTANTISQLVFQDFTPFNNIPGMASLFEHANGWHPGEQAVHALLKVPTSSRRNPTAAGLPPSNAYRVSVSPLLAIGTVDDQGRPWTSIVGGEPGFTRPVAQGILGVQSLVDKAHDPVVQALLGSAADGEVLQPGDGTIMSALSIDLETRDRVKLAGKMAVGTLAGVPGSESIGDMQIAMHVQESMGNCPKYLNKKTIHAHKPSPQLVSSSLPLPPEALALIEKADIIFVSSTNGQTMDTNHRGGPPGFVRVASNRSPPSDGGVVLVYPEYSGNRLYQTLGNLHSNPRIGVVIPDFDTSSVLYLTGETQLLVGASAAALMPHTNLAVKITVHAARFVRDGLPFRGTPGEPSPYNPPVRRLAHEYPSSLMNQTVENSSSSPLATATLLRREPLTPSIARFTFRLNHHSPRDNGSRLAKPAVKTWLPGQHITLSFAGELSHGWSHMNDADPQSLNDDYVRTFTISTPPPSSQSQTDRKKEEEKEKEVLVELTVRKHGPATKLLFAHHLAGVAGAAAPLEVPVLGVGGLDGFRIPVDDGTMGERAKKAVFVAGGVGITPLLAQAPGVLEAAAALAAKGEVEEKAVIEVLWSLRADDLPLAVDAFERVDGLAGVTRVFVTSTGENEEKEKAVVERMTAMGARVEVRRMGQGDVLGARHAARGAKYFVCTGPEMLKSVLDWLGEEEVAFESFEY